jgi:catechol 2,3-dioxygenase-like lactoylglutathione lyase family enzyme
MLDHVGIQVADVAASAAFYDAVLAPLGFTKQMDFGEAIGFGTEGNPAFWISLKTTDTIVHEAHVAFVAGDRDKVVAFRDAAVALGAEVLHEPRLFPEYHPSYFGTFVRDPDGNNIEAVCHAPV